MSEHPGPPTLSLALGAVIGAAVPGDSRTGLLSVVRPGDAPGAPGGADAADGARPRVVPFPAPRRPLDDGPSAA